MSAIRKVCMPPGFISSPESPSKSITRPPVGRGSDLPKKRSVPEKAESDAPCGKEPFEGGRMDSGWRDRPPDSLWALSLIHISEPTRRTPISYAVFCLKKKKIF